MSFILDNLSSLFNASKPATAGRKQAPFANPQTLPEFLVNLQWLEDEVSLVLTTLVPKIPLKLQGQKQQAIALCDEMTRTAAATREFCLNDNYNTWKAFISLIPEAVSLIRTFGIEDYHKDPARWDEFWCRISLNKSCDRLRSMLREVGQGAIAERIERHWRTHPDSVNTAVTRGLAPYGVDVL